jgi:glutamyl-tRNA synthetase
MSREEILERFTLEAVSASPGTFDYAKLDWMNGVYLRTLAPDAYADEVVTYLGESGVDWPDDRVRAMAPLVQEKVGRLGEIPDFTRFLFEDVDPEPDLLDGRILQAAEGALTGVDDWTASELEAALKRLCEGLGEKPRTVFAPIRVAVTGSRVSPGLYESLELLGRETTLERLRRGAELAA